MKVLILCLTTLLTMILLSGCDEKSFSKEQFIGKARKEVLASAFEKCERRMGKEKTVVIEIVSPSGSLDNRYYKTLEDACADEKLMNAANWRVMYKWATPRMLGKDHYVDLFFEKEKVIKAELRSYRPQ